MKTTTISLLLPFFLLLLLVLLSITAQTVWASNNTESSYRVGMKLGHWEYQQCYKTHTCDVSENYYNDLCTDPHYRVLGTYVHNQTAYQDGYTRGWIKECLIDNTGNASASATCKPQPNPISWTYAKCIKWRERIMPLFIESSLPSRK